MSVLTRAETAARSALAEDVRAGLDRVGQKRLPSMYLYDEVGSALFEAISRLPEYGLTRADERILQRASGAIAARLDPPLRVVELGSGSGRKTRWLLEAVARRHPTHYHPIDISATALEQCERELGALPGVRWAGLERDYLGGLAEASARRQPGERLLVLFLGSTIGNFDRPAGLKFLRQVRGILQAGDSLLLGTDLEKPVHQLISAYDDSVGVTAAFNLNLLARINRELDADFDLHQFEHVARFNGEARSVEMHLRSKRGQTVTIYKAGFSTALLEGETIWTESSHKYSPDEMFQIAQDAGFRCQAQWIDDEWPFAENLLIAE